MTRPKRHSLTLAALAAGLLLPGGCGGGQLKPVPVSGTVTVGGKAADGALVRLWPVGDDGPDAARPLGYADPDGAFKLTTVAEHDGAPPGRYKVTVEWRPRKKSTTEADGPDKLKGRYADPKLSKIEVTVNAAETRLEPIALD